jgi:hypothetical protein
MEIVGDGLIDGNATVNELTPDSFLYSGVDGLLTTTTAPTNGQLLIGRTGLAPALGALTGSSTINVTPGAGTITLSLSSDPILPGNSYVTVPVGTTAQRPGTPMQGMIRYNTTIGSFERYERVNWLSYTGLLDKTTTNLVFTTAGPNTLFSYLIPGGTLGTDSVVRLQSAGRLQNTSGSNRTVTISVSYGGTTIWSDNSTSIPTGGDAGWEMDLRLIANDSVTSQQLVGRIQIGGTGATATGLTGDLASDEIIATAIIVGNVISINSAANQTLAVTITASGTAITCTKYYHTLEVL